MKIGSLAILCCAAFAQIHSARGDDWPQFLGPQRNGIATGTKLADVWPKEGPHVVWQRKVGQGFSGPAVSGNKLILFHRLDDREVVEACDAKSGKPLWKYESETAYRDDFGFDEGPRATPAISGGKIYCFGAEGTLLCLDLETGKEIWKVATKEKYSSGKGFFGLVCSPLVEGEYVLLNIGGANGAGIVAFDKNTGKLAWKATDDEASYSSPVIANLAGQRYAIFFTRKGLVVLDPKDGKIQSQFPWRSRMNASVNAATPLVVNDQIFLSASYGTGATLLQWKDGKISRLWASDDALSSHYATSVYKDGFLYGFHGRQEDGPTFRCVEWKTGKVRWEHEGHPAGTVTLADDRLLLLFEDGRLVLAAASPDRYQQLAEAQILPTGVRAYPAVANGYLYARSKDRLICVDLKPQP